MSQAVADESDRRDDSSVDRFCEEVFLSPPHWDAGAVPRA